MFGFDLNQKQKLAIFAIAGLAIAWMSYSHFSQPKLGSGDTIVIEDSAGDARVVSNDGDPLPDTPIRNAGKVICHVTGCVKNPGVYTLEAGERVVDAVNAAGGPKSDADLDVLNLAAKVEDGSKIEVPSTEDTRVAMTGRALGAVKPGKLVSSSTSGDSSGKLRTPGEGLVHINSASLEELQRLPGVGPATAEKVIAYRTSIRKFAQPEQLMDVKGIGPKTFEKMRPFVAL